MNNKVVNVGVHPYDPARGQKKPIAQIEAYRWLEQYILATPLELKGEGIYLLDNIFIDQSKMGWNRYKVTYEAFDKLAQEYAIMIESLAD